MNLQPERNASEEISLEALLLSKKPFILSVPKPTERFVGVDHIQSKRGPLWENIIIHEGEGEFARGAGSMIVIDPAQRIYYERKTDKKFKRYAGDFHYRHMDKAFGFAAFYTYKGEFKDVFSQLQSLGYSFEE